MPRVCGGGAFALAFQDAIQTFITMAEDAAAELTSSVKVNEASSDLKFSHHYITNVG